MTAEEIMEGVVVRQETRADIPAIHRVNQSAFGGEQEARMVEALRASPAFVPELSLVAESHGRVVGHVLLFRADLVSPEGSRNILALAPLAVAPSQSHRGIGSSLVRAGVTKAGSLGYGGIVVIGQPEYYRRLGFRPAADYGIECSINADQDVVTVLELVKGAFAGGGTVRYPPEFARLFG